MSVRNIPRTVGILCGAGDAELWTFGRVHCGVWKAPMLGHNTVDLSARHLTDSKAMASPFSPAHASRSPLPEKKKSTARLKQTLTDLILILENMHMA